MIARAVKINVLGVEHFRVALRLLMCGDKVTNKQTVGVQNLVVIVYSHASLIRLFPWRCTVLQKVFVYCYS